MASPRQIDDGDWSVKSQVGIAVPSYPLFSRGDGGAWQARATFQQDIDSYLRPSLMSRRTIGGLGLGYLVDVGDATDTGCGIMEWDEIYCSLPSTRTEPMAYPHVIQYWRTKISGGDDKYFYNVTHDIEEIAFTMGGYMEYEYFVNTRPKPLIKNRVFLIYEKMYKIGSPSQSPSGTMVADDSSITTYMGRIYERATPYILLPPRTLQT